MWRFALSRQPAWNDRGASWKPRNMILVWLVGGTILLVGTVAITSMAPFPPSGAGLWGPITGFLLLMGLWVVLVVATAAWAFLSVGPVLPRLVVSFAALVFLGVSLHIGVPSRSRGKLARAFAYTSATTYGAFAACFLVLRVRGYRLVSSAPLTE